MRNAKKTLSMMMVAIFTTFIVLSGVPASAATAAQAKAQVTKATAAVVKVEKTVKVATFNPTTAQTQLNAAVKEVAKVKSLGKTYTATYTKLVARDAVVAKKIAARKLAIANAAKAKMFTDADKAVTEAEKATNPDEVDLVGDAAALATAQGAITNALELIVKLDKNSANYKGLMARVDAANGLIVKAMEDITAAEEAAKLAAEAKAKLEAAVAAAETAVKAVEAAPLKTEADLTAALALGVTAKTAVDAVTDADAAAAFTARLKVVADAGLALKAKLAADAEALKPATLVSVIAADGTITVNFDKKPLTTVSAVDFTVTRTITTVGAVTTDVVVGPITVVSDTAISFTVPAVTASATEQSVVYTVKYTTGTAVAAAAYKVAATPVLSATAATTNLKEIKVVFNQEVDATTAETATNYTITGITVNAATLQADKKTVLLETSTLGQQTAYTIAVANVKSAATMVAKSIEVSFTALDLTVPTAVSATITGPKTLKVTFSEPVNVIGSYTIDNNTYSIAGATIDADDTHTVVVTLGASLPAGTHTVTVSGANDFANFAAAKATLSFNYVADTSALTATLTTASQNSVKITFNKAIDAATKGFLSVYHTYNNNSSYVGGTPVWATDNMSVTVPFATYLPIGTATVYVNAGADTTNVLADAWGNKFTSVALTGTVVADLTAPTATVKVISNTQIDVTYSKEVTGAATAANYTFKNSAGTAITVAAAVDGTNAKLYHLTFAQQNGGTFTLAIANIKDTAIAQNAMAAFSTSFTISDTIAPTVLSATYSTDLKKVFVKFSEAMATTGAYSVLDLNKYQILLNGSTITELSDVTDVTIAAGTDAKSVTITFPTAQTFSSAKMNIARVADVAGNVTTALVTSDVAVNPASITATNITKIKVIATNKVQFDVDSIISTMDVNKFTVAGTTPSAVTYVNNGTSATITVTTAPGRVFTSDVASSVTPQAIVLAGAFTDANGISNAQVAINLDSTNDYVGPSIVSRTVTSPTAITVVFSENLYAASVAYDAFTVAGHTITNVAFSGNNTLVLTLGETVTDTETPAVQLVKSVMDASAQHNVLSAETVGVKATALVH